MNSPKQIAVLGRGIAGLCAAYHLVKAGFHPTVFGKKSGPETASRAAQGVLCNKGLIFFDSPLFKAKVESLATMQVFLTELEKVSGHPIPRFFRGVSEPFWTAEDFQATVSRVYRHKFWGCHQSEARGPWLSLPGSLYLPLGELFYPNDGWFDPSAVLDALEAYLDAQGIGLLDEKVLEFGDGDQGKVKLKTDQQELSFDTVIVATGAGTEELWKQLGLADQRMFLIGGQTLRIKRSQAIETKILVKGNQSVALLPELTILGSTSWKGFVSESLEADAAELLAKTEASFGLHLAGETESRTGVRLRFKDRMPLVGWVSSGPYAKKVYLLTGFYKNGMHLAETCAQEMILDIVGRSEERRYAGFSPLRFSV
ncbi:MAG: FAD-binding oxidoreductase [Oligoflexus sp.]|nr:FAD-binding oxidoreductase [Oligoflexus sp.]